MHCLFMRVLRFSLCLSGSSLSLYPTSRATPDAREPLPMTRPENTYTHTLFWSLSEKKLCLECSLASNVALKVGENGSANIGTSCCCKVLSHLWGDSEFGGIPRSEALPSGGNSDNWGHVIDLIGGSRTRRLSHPSATQKLGVCNGVGAQDKDMLRLGSSAAPIEHWRYPLPTRAGKVMERQQSHHEGKTYKDKRT